MPADPFGAQHAAGQETTDQHDHEAEHRLAQMGELDQQRLFQRGEDHHAHQRPQQQAGAPQQSARDGNQRDAQIEHGVGRDIAELPGLNGARQSGEASAQHEGRQLEDEEANARHFRHLLIIADGAQRIAKARAHQPQGHRDGERRQQRGHVERGDQHIIRRQGDAVAALGQPIEIIRQQFAQRHDGQRREGEIVALQAKQRQGDQQRRERAEEHRRRKAWRQRRAAREQDREGVGADAVEREMA